MDWDEKKEPIRVDLMKEWITEMRMAYDIYEEARELASEAHAKFKEKEQTVIQALEASGLKNFNVPGLGTAATRVTYKVTCPKTIEDKRLLFKYVEEKYGAEFLDSFRSINSQTLNKFYNEEVQAAEEEGKEIKIPGLADPVEHVGISFRKDK